MLKLLNNFCSYLYKRTFDKRVMNIYSPDTSPSSDDDTASSHSSVAEPSTLQVVSDVEIHDHAHDETEPTSDG